MKILVIEKIPFLIDLDEDFTDMLRKFSIYTVESEGKTFLSEQKICLTEIDMNTFLSEVEYNGALDFSLTYIPLGGEGCEVSFDMKHAPLEEKDVKCHLT